MAEMKMLRPYAWIKLPGIKGPDNKILEFHTERDDGMDRRFSYLTDFEFESATGGTIGAKFSIIDYEYKVTHAIFEMEKLREKIQKDGGTRPKIMKERMAVLWQFGWHVSDSSENPWRTHKKSRFSKGRNKKWSTGVVRDDSPVFRGNITGLSLSVSEGITKYDFSIGGPTQYTQHNFLPNNNGKGNETKFNENTAYKLIKAILGRVDLSVHYTKEAEKIVKASEVTEEYDVGRKPIGVCIRHILRNYCKVSKNNKIALRVVEKSVFGKGDNKFDFLIETYDRNAKRGGTIRNYVIGITKDNMVIDFSPSLDKQLMRGLAVGSVGNKPDGTSSMMDTAKEGKSEQGVARSNAAVVDNDISRESSIRVRTATRQAAKQTHSVRNAFAGATAELTIVGDPGLVYYANEKSGWLSAGGKFISLYVQKFPYIQGKWGNLKWKDDGQDKKLSGKYQITRVSHSMGSSRPYETSLSLQRVVEGDEIELYYKDILET